MSKPSDTEKVVNTVCHDHCTNACLLKLHVRDGIITRIETDDGQEPQYRACAKGRAYRQLVYSPDRLKYPLRRTGERGEGKFERISWDEALNTVASELKRVKATYGARATILLCSGGDIGWLHNGGLIDRVLVRVGGYTGVIGTVSDEGTRFASMATYGVDDLMTANSRDNLLKSRLIILWGWNPVITRTYGGHMPSILSQLKEAGARVIAVDPRYTETAAFLDAQWIPIRPGTDAAMLIAMAHVMITENLQDQAFLDKYTIGFNEFKGYVLGEDDGVLKTPQWAEDITGVPAATIASLAREYATAKPAALMDGFAPGRTAYGEQFNRAAATLIAMNGNLGIPGGSAGCGPIQTANPALALNLPGIHLRMRGGANPVDLASPLRSDSILYQRVKRNRSFSVPVHGDFYFGGPSTAYLNRVRVADAILEGRNGGYPADYKLLYMVTINWLNQYANVNKIIRALKKLEFVVVHEQFMTPTAKFADIILPQNTILERNDLATARLMPFYGHREKAIDSLGESKSMFEIATGLAAKLGISDFSDKTEEEWLREVVKEWKDIPDYDTLRKEGMCKFTPKPFVAFEKQINDPVNNPFPTPSGKVEIYSQALADMGNPMIPHIPKYIETWESRNDSLAKKYTLQLITTHYWRRTHSRFDKVPWLMELEAQAVLINSADAKARGIEDGDMVRVFNNRGQTIIPARVTERIMPGVVDIPEGAWFDPDEKGIDRGGCPNVLLNDEPSPGGALCSNTALVQVEKT